MSATLPCKSGLMAPATVRVKRQAGVALNANVRVHDPRLQRAATPQNPPGHKPPRLLRFFYGIGGM